MIKVHTQRNLQKLLVIALVMVIAIGTKMNWMANASLVADNAINGLDMSALGMSFVPNRGQTDPMVLYHARGLRGELFFKSQSVVFSLPVPTVAGDELTSYTAVELEFIGQSEEAKLQPLESLTSKVNYFVGNDPSNWLVDIPSYSGVEYENIYAGINLSYFAADGQLKSTFTVAAGVNPSQIRWQYKGAERTWVDATTSNLMIALNGGEILREQSPIAWQNINGEKHPVALAFRVNADGIVDFVIGNYDSAYTLVLDPVIEYSSYIGGSSADQAYAVTADNDGNAFVVGYSESSNFPTSVGALQTARQGAKDAFIVKIDTNASGAASLVWATYFGGGAGEEATGVDLDGDGNIYITGYTGSSGAAYPEFPTTGNAFQTAYGSCCTVNAFLTKFDPTGTTLLYSSYLGGSGPDEAYGISVDSNGNAYITGVTSAANFPTTANAYLTTGTQSSQIFVSKFDTNASGSASLVYSTYIFGNDTDVANGIAADDAGNAFITGKTESTNFPVTAGAYQSSLKTIANGDGVDAIILRLDTSQSGSASLVYSSYFGGQTNSTGQAGVENFNTNSGSIETDGSGIVYFTGETTSVDLPVVNGYQTIYRGGAMDAFVAKIDTEFSGSASLLYSSYLGGNDYDKGYGIAADQFGNAYVIGVSQSTNFPVLNGLAVASGGFVTRINTNASGNASLLSSTRLGGADANGIGDSFVDANATVYTTGQISGNTFPIVDGFQASYAGNTDAYIVRLSYYSDIQVTRSETSNPAAVNSARNYTLTVTNLGNDTATKVDLTETLTGTLTINSAVPSQGSCTIDALEISCELGNIFKNGIATIAVTFTPSVSGTVNKAAVGDATEIDTSTTNNQSNGDTTVLNTADLSISQSDSPDPVVATEDLTYNITVNNSGPYDATDLILSDTLAAGVNYVSATASQGTGCNLVGSVVTCNLGDVNLSASATVEIVVSPSAAATLSHTVSVVSDEIDPNTANNASTITTTVLPPPPAAPTLLTPANSTSLAVLQPVFTWNRPTGAVRFEIQIDANPAMTATSSSLTVTSFIPSGPLLTTTYNWRVRAFNVANVPSEWSNTNHVTILSPANSAPLANYYTTDTPTLSWNSVTGASQYEIQVDNSSTFTVPLEFSIIIPASSLSVTTTPLSEGSHYWRVRAINGATLGAWSAVSSFLVDIP